MNDGASLKARMEQPDTVPSYLYIARVSFYDNIKGGEDNSEHIEIDAENAAVALTQILDRHAHRQINRIQLYRVDNKVTDFSLNPE